MNRSITSENFRLIAGIDPGTTVGWAVLNLRGEVVAVDSKKEFDLDSVIALFTRLGRVILVGSDKSKVPSFVAEAATKLGIKVICPSQDMRVEEKRDLTRDLPFQNAHEMDALASALLAFRKVQPLLNKIHAFLQREKRLGLFEDVVELVLNEGISIRAAVEILTPKPEQVFEEQIEEPKRDEDVIHLYTALARVRKDNAVLLAKNRELDKKISRLEQQLDYLKKHAAGLVKPKSPAEQSMLKERQVQSLAQRLENSAKIQEVFKARIEMLERALLRHDRVPLLRLSHLGWDQVEKNKEFIHEEGVLFVDDANLLSQKAVDWLADKGIQLILCKKMPGKRAAEHLPFACVPAEDFELLDRVVLVKRLWLDKVRSERVVLAKIVQEYKKERST